MRRFLVTICLAALVSPLAVSVGTGTAHACRPAPTFQVPKEAFVTATSLVDLNSPTGPVGEAFNEWFELEGEGWSDGQSAIIGVYRLTTVVYASPPPDSISGGAEVRAFEALWGDGQATDFAPVPIRFDTSTCAGSVNPDRLGDSIWWIVTDSNERYGFSPLVDEYNDLEAALTRLFDEPRRPELDVAEVAVALDEILQDAAIEFDEPVTDIRLIAALDEAGIDPTVDDSPVVQDVAQGQSGEELVIANRTVAADDSWPGTTTVIFGVGAVAALAAAGVFAWRRINEPSGNRT